jgi:hypothetical protein
MNIFYLHHSAQVVPKLMTSKHVVKMIVETAQLLSTAHHVLDGDNAIKGIYKKTHANHPSAIWTRESISNYLWLKDHGLALLNEYALRYHKLPQDHATYDVIIKLKHAPIHIPNIFKLTPMRIAITDTKYHVKDNAIQSYRNYYEGEKLRIDADKIRYFKMLDEITKGVIQ